MTNLLASGWSGLNRKFAVSGTIALGICSKTASFLWSHAVPRFRVSSRRDSQFSGRSSSVMTETFSSGPLIFSRVNSGGTSFALV